ncbi:unannotated protein [freshwater metagenome]|uniref:Unannotated protein n=1 Tax=freshwater metagenome TaxID=449393 RepID=A0A6J6DH15_9ZZZZ
MFHSELQSSAGENSAIPENTSRMASAMIDTIIENRKDTLEPSEFSAMKTT